MQLWRVNVRKGEKRIPKSSTRFVKFHFFIFFCFPSICKTIPSLECFSSSSSLSLSFHLNKYALLCLFKLIHFTPSFYPTKRKYPLSLYWCCCLQNIQKIEKKIIKDSIKIFLKFFSSAYKNQHHFNRLRASQIRSNLENEAHHRNSYFNWWKWWWWAKKTNESQRGK